VFALYLDLGHAAGKPAGGPARDDDASQPDVIGDRGTPPQFGQIFQVTPVPGICTSMASAATLYFVSGSDRKGQKNLSKCGAPHTLLLR